MTSLVQGLMKGRSHIIFMAGLIAAAGIIVSLERSSLLAPPLPGATTPAEREAAAIAWAAAARAPDHAGAQRLAQRLGVDTAARLPATTAMSPAAGEAVLAALLRAHEAPVPAQ